jgi:hypothetical protein
MSENDSRLGDIVSDKKWKAEPDRQLERKNITTSHGSDTAPSLDEKHPLFQSFSFWFVRKPTGTMKSRYEAYEQGVQCLTTFSTVEDFWANYNHIERPGDNPVVYTCDIFLFREGVKPMWEVCGYFSFRHSLIVRTMKTKMEENSQSL